MNLNFLKEVIKMLVDHPEVNIETVDTGRTLIILLDVHPDDRKFVIGKNGITIQALRRIFCPLIGNQIKKRVFIEVKQ